MLYIPQFWGIGLYPFWVAQRGFHLEYSTAWSIGKAVGALALQILMPDMIAFATQLNTLR